MALRPKPSLAKRIPVLRGLFPPVAAVLAVALAGCSFSLTNISPGYRPGEHEENGVALFSLTNSVAFPGFTVGQKRCEGLDSLALRIQKAGGEEALPSVTWKKNSPPPRLERGRLVAVALPAGDYRIAGWEGVLRGGFQDYHLRGKADYPFSLAPGKVTYLGNVHVQFAEGDADAAICGFPSGLSIRDASARDVELFRKSFPNGSEGPLVNLIGQREAAGEKPPASPAFTVQRKVHYRN